jgi:hypothetical protein
MALDAETAAFRHQLFHWSCISAAIGLMSLATLEATPQSIMQVLTSLRLVDAAVLMGLGFWSDNKSGKLAAPILAILYILYLILFPRISELPYQYAALGVYVVVLATASLSLSASWDEIKN